jgi:hypothetical protein
MSDPASGHGLRNQAESCPMIYLLYAVVGVYAISILWFIYAVSRAPEGREDERGFRSIKRTDDDIPPKK